MKEMKKKLLEIIDHKRSELHEEDAEGHIWWGRFKELVESMRDRTTLTDAELNVIRDEYFVEWRKNNPNYPESDYWSGVNDGMYHLRNKVQSVRRELESEMFNHEMTRIAWDKTTEQRDGLLLQVKALSAAKRGLEKSLDECMQNK